MIDKPENFWHRLMGWIEQEGINLHKFSKLAGINYMSLKAPYERIRIPGPEILLKIAEYTGLSMEYFLTGKDPWTGTKVKDVALVKEVMQAPDETRRRIKAMLEADMKIVEEKKKEAAKGKKADNDTPDETRKVGNG